MEKRAGDPARCCLYVVGASASSAVPPLRVLPCDVIRPRVAAYILTVPTLLHAVSWVMLPSACAYPSLSIGPPQGGRHHVYQGAKAPTEATFLYHVGEVNKLNPAAAEKLLSIPHNTWANYACRDNVIWDQVTSNMSESVNNMIGHEVYMPFLHYTQGGIFAPCIVCDAVVLEQLPHVRVSRGGDCVVLALLYFK